MSISDLHVGEGKDDIPGHVIVQEQLRDVVLAQQRTIEYLTEEVIIFVGN